MQNTTVQSQHWSRQKYMTLCYIHGYCRLIGSCSMLIGDNESSNLETFMIYCKHDTQIVCLFPYNYALHVRVMQQLLFILSSCIN